MKKHLLIALIGVGSIIGLIFIQVNLLKVGVLLEKERFDQKMKTVLHEVNLRIDDHQEVQQSLVYFYKTDFSEFRSQDWKKLDQLRDSIGEWLKTEMAEKGLQIGYSFAIIDADSKLPLLTSKNFFNETFEYEKHNRPLGGKTLLQCWCRLSLHFHADNLFNYLLKQLAYLIIPSALFLLLLLGALVYLIYNLHQQRKLAGLKNDFINNLTHELKTPVFSVSLLAKVMREHVKNGNYKKLLEHIGLIEKENEQMKEHVDKVLELASLESGKYELQKEKADIHQLLEEVIEHFSIKFSNKGGHLIRHLEASHTKALVDKVHFKNALQNLLENALKYNDKKPIVSIGSSNENGSIILTISDNGVGIKPEYQKYIFDKFYRVPKGDLHSVKGFGLGLSYVRQIIEAHKGRIQVKSQPGKGSQFRIEVPYQ